MTSSQSTLSTLGFDGESVRVANEAQTDGSTASSEESTAQETKRYVQAIMSDLRVLRNNLIYDYDTISPSFVKECLAQIVEECNKLRTMPRAFQDEQAGCKFFDAVRRGLGDIVDILKLYENHNEQCARVFEQAESRKAAETRPSFRPDLTPWEQFLNYGAPGLPLPTTAGHDQENLRVLPPAGTAILSNWRNRTQILRRNMNMVSESKDVHCAGCANPLKHDSPMMDDEATRLTLPRSTIPTDVRTPASLAESQDVDVS